MNLATRLGNIVTGVYPGNAADRKRLLERIGRIGQCREEVTALTVTMAGTILELLHERHSAVDLANATLEQLGEHFSSELLQMIA